MRKVAGRSSLLGGVVNACHVLAAPPPPRSGGVEELEVGLRIVSRGRFFFFVFF